MLGKIVKNIFKELFYMMLNMNIGKVENQRGYMYLFIFDDFINLIVFKYYNIFINDNLEYFRLWSEYKYILFCIYIKIFRRYQRYIRSL